MRQSIQDITGKFKVWLASDTLFTAMLLLLVGIGSFGLGRSAQPVVIDDRAGVGAVAVASEARAEPLPASTATNATSVAPLQLATSTLPTAQTYVGSKNGTKFHLLSCPGASQIKEENKVYFSSKQEAYSKGYTEAANCKGI